jgi:hypothetical protein
MGRREKRKREVGEFTRFLYNENDCAYRSNGSKKRLPSGSKAAGRFRFDVGRDLMRTGSLAGAPEVRCLQPPTLLLPVSCCWVGCISTVCACLIRAKYDGMSLKASLSLGIQIALCKTCIFVDPTV